MVFLILKSLSVVLANMSRTLAGVDFINPIQHRHHGCRTAWTWSEMIEKLPQTIMSRISAFTYRLCATGGLSIWSCVTGPPPLSGFQKRLHVPVKQQTCCYSNTYLVDGIAQLSMTSRCKLISCFIILEFTASSDLCLEMCLSAIQPRAEKTIMCTCNVTPHCLQNDTVGKGSTCSELQKINMGAQW